LAAGQVFTAADIEAKAKILGATRPLAGKWKN
jgi:hypothetical protein